MLKTHLNCLTEKNIWFMIFKKKKTLKKHIPKTIYKCGVKHMLLPLLDVNIFLKKLKSWILKKKI